jgi:hypothetical protein
MAWHGMAWKGNARQGMTWHGMESECKARHGMERQGMAWHGKARHGLARKGKARCRSRSLIYLVSALSKSLMVIS